jgi:hypothetical protein
MTCINESRQELSGRCFLVGVSNRLFLIESDCYQVRWSRDDYASCGCGKEAAYGALYATADKSPKARALTALKAAAHHSGGVVAPFTILKTKKMASG